jgi:hypothetical protein
MTGAFPSSLHSREWISCFFAFVVTLFYQIQ